MGEISIFESREWIKAYEKLVEKGREFTDLYNTLESTTTTDGELEEIRRDLLNRGVIIKTTIDYIRTGANAAYSIFNNFSQENNLNGLGLFWIPIMAITSILGTLTYWVNDTVKFFKQTAAVKKLESDGVPVAQAWDIVKGGDMPLTELRRIIPWIIGGGIALFLLPRIFK